MYLKIFLTLTGLMTLCLNGELRAMRASPPLERYQSIKPQNIPDIPFKAANEQELQLKDFKGQFLLVHFWASWCPHCIKEMQLLDKMSPYLSNQSIKVLTISNDFSGLKSVKAFYQKYHLKNLTPYIDQYSYLRRAFKAQGLPTTIFINKEGQEIGRIEGPIKWNHPNILKALKQLQTT